MPQNRYNFTSPGALAGDAIEQLMIQRAAERRQALMDQLAQEQAAREAETHKSQLETAALNRTNLEAQMDDRARQGVMSDLELFGPQDQLSPEMIDRATRFGVPINRQVLQGDQIGMADELGPDIPLYSTSQSATRRMSPEERQDAELKAEMAALLQDPDVPDAIKQQVKFSMRGVKVPASMFEPDEGEIVERGGYLYERKSGEKDFKRIGSSRNMAAEAAQFRAGAGEQDSGPSPYAAERVNRTRQSVTELMGKVSRWTVGAGSLLAGMPESEARDFAAQLNTLKANIAFNELAQMREASKTGGALGAVSERELALLESALGALDPGQSPENFRQQLKKIDDSLARWQAAQAGMATPGRTGEPSAPASIEDLRKRYGY
jgi:hypothetical protein